MARIAPDRTLSELLTTSEPAALVTPRIPSPFAARPWLVQQLEDAEETLGTDYWSYGLAANRDNLATFLRYHHEQGLSPRLLGPRSCSPPRPPSRRWSDLWAAVATKQAATSGLPRSAV